MTSRTLSNFVTPPWQLTAALGVVLGAAGVMHISLAPQHMGFSVVFGAGFLAAGIAQLYLAAMAVLRPSGVIYSVIIATTIALTSLYAYNVVVGLPLHEPAVVAGTEEHTSDAAHGHAPEDGAATHAASGSHDHHHAGTTTGTGEPIDPYGVITQLAQLSAAALALALLVREPPATA